MKIFVLVFSLLATSFWSSGQPIDFPQDRSGKLYTCDGYAIQFNRLIIQEDSIVCMSKGIEIKYALQNVYKIEKKGNHILVMTLVFAGIGIAAGSAVASAWDEDVLGKPKSYPVLIYTGVFAVGGFVFGALWPRYKTVYTKSSITWKASPQLYFTNNEIISGITLKFQIN